MAEAQNFHLAAKNYTNFDFQAGTENMTHGGVYNKSNIKKQTTTIEAFYTRGDKDASAGTQGKLTYTSTDNAATITFDWDIPWGAGDEYLNVSVTGPIKLAKSSFRGDEVKRRVVEIDISDDKPLL